MKLVIGIIQPEKFPDVKQALQEAGVTKMTVSKVKGCGQQMGFEESFKGHKHSVHLLDKIRIAIVVNDSYEQPTIDAIVKGARTGNIGDGKIFVQDMDRVIRIRTGEEGNEAVG
ncbi:MAG: P-II family nitrogen regulator [Deltaproteobacteria bacterium]|nr:P-II family nitrogen regulator [Deltaproteobacteria bacterium]